MLSKNVLRNWAIAQRTFGALSLYSARVGACTLPQWVSCITIGVRYLMRQVVQTIWIGGSFRLPGAARSM